MDPLSIIVGQQLAKPRKKDDKKLLDIITNGVKKISKPIIDMSRGAAKYSKVMHFLNETPYKIPKKYEMAFSFYIKGWMDLIEENNLQIDVVLFDEAIRCYNAWNDDPIIINKKENSSAQITNNTVNIININSNEIEKNKYIDI